MKRRKLSTDEAPSGTDSGLLSSPTRKRRSYNTLTSTTQLVYKVFDVVADFEVAVEVILRKDTGSRDLHQLEKLSNAANLKIENLKKLRCRLEKRIDEIQTNNPNPSQISALSGAITSSKRDSPSKRQNTKISSHEQLFDKMDQAFKDFSLLVRMVCSKIDDVGDLPKLKRLPNTAKISIEDLEIARDGAIKFIGIDTASTGSQTRDSVNHNAGSPNTTSSSGDSKSNSSEQKLQSLLNMIGQEYSSELAYNFKQYVENHSK